MEDNSTTSPGKVTGIETEFTGNAAVNQNNKSALQCRDRSATTTIGTVHKPQHLSTHLDKLSLDTVIPTSVQQTSVSPDRQRAKTLDLQSQSAVNIPETTIQNTPKMHCFYPSNERPRYHNSQLSGSNSDRGSDHHSNSSPLHILIPAPPPAPTASAVTVSSPKSSSQKVMTVTSMQHEADLPHSKLLTDMRFPPPPPPSSSEIGAISDASSNSNMIPSKTTPSVTAVCLEMFFMSMDEFYPVVATVCNCCSNNHTSHSLLTAYGHNFE